MASWVRPDGGAELDAEDVQLVIGALDDAAWYRVNHADAGDLATVDRYRGLAYRLGDDRGWTSGSCST